MSWSLRGYTAEFHDIKEPQSEQLTRNRQPPQEFSKRRAAVCAFDSGAGRTAPLYSGGSGGCGRPVA